MLGGRVALFCTVFEQLKGQIVIALFVGGEPPVRTDLKLLPAD
jgi:hypothetical protein